MNHGRPADSSWIEARFRILLEAAPDAMLVVDERGSIVLSNQQTTEIFGYTPSELIGQKVEVLIPPRFRGIHPARREGYFSGNPRVRPMGACLELYGLRKDGTEFPVEVSLSPIPTPGGTMVLSAMRDVSARRHAEEQIRKLNGELELALYRADRLAATGRLIATIAHEINNPLESLTNILHLLQINPSLDQSAQEMVAIAAREVARLTALSHQTLAPHRESPLPVVTRVSDLLDEVSGGFRGRLEDAHITLERSYKHDGEVTIRPGDLRQVFTNLISNAIDAVGNAGTIHLSIERAGQKKIVVRVRDSGCGIPAVSLAKIFDPFYTTKGEKGTGIGLWVTRNIVEKLGGRIEVESSTAVPSGSTFSVVLPVAASRAGDVEEPELRSA